MNSSRVANKRKGLPENELLSLHLKLHVAIKESNLLQVQELLNLQVIELCNPSIRNNCYILAQNNEDPEFLKVLLEYDSSGVNSIDRSGDSLLMRDIVSFDSKHFQLLLDKGADVSHCNDVGGTAFHYSMMQNIPLDDFNNLLLSSHELNKPLNVHSETPLIVAMLYDELNTFGKVILMLEFGAEINLEDKNHKTPLMVLCENKVCVKRLEMCKYLLEHGAKASSHSVLAEFVRNFVSNHTDSPIIIKEESLLIEVIDLLIAAEENMFLKDKDGKSPLDYFMTSITGGSIKYARLFLELVKAGFNKLTNASLKIDEELQWHPLKSVLLNFEYVVQNTNLFKSIADLIVYHPTNEFKNLTIGHEVYNMKKVNISVVGVFVATLPLKDIKQWLVTLHENNFDINRQDPLFDILMNQLISFNKVPLEEKVCIIIDYLIEQQYKVCGPFRFDNHFLSAGLLDVFQMLDVPGCVWYSAFLGKAKCLKKFLPYWNQQPIAILLFLRPWVFENVLKSIDDIVPLLCELGGPLTHGTVLYYLLKQFIKNCQIKATGGCVEHKDVINVNCDQAETYTKIANCLIELHKNPVELKILCRTVIRANAVGHGNNLPNKLKALVAGTVLEDFLALTQQ